MSTVHKKNTFSKPEISVEDLTLALHQANIRLSEANRRLMESERKRSDILANISHDLRSPLTTLRGYVEYLLAFERLDELELHSILNKMHEKFLSLDYLMSELLLLTELDSSEEAVRPSPVCISNYLRSFFCSCEADPRYAGRRLLLKIPEEYHYLCLLDSDMFLRVLDNLFTNALKFSRDGDEIILQTELLGNEIIISVSDSGIGIEDKYLQLIFERTYKISTSRTPGQVNGCGLGLSIASSIMKKHGGRIWCESKKEKGSTFYLALPLYQP